MRLVDMNWRQVEDWLIGDDRCVLPVGSTEQHAGLSLGVDSILAERMALEAAEPTGVPVFPPLNYGLTPYFMAYPGTVTLRPGTYTDLLEDILTSLVTHGFRRILVVNGHGGNAQVIDHLMAWADATREVQLLWHNWWNAPQVQAAVDALDPVGAHASWKENFPWTRLAGVTPPNAGKPVAKGNVLDGMPPEQVRESLGDGNMGGDYQKPDEDMLKIWQTGVLETRDLLERGWAP